MEIIKTAIIGVSFRDLQKTPTSTHLFAEVVLIDKSHEPLQPFLYQLKKEALYGTDDLATIPKEFVSMQRDAFFMIGEVVEIDRKKKMITLSNASTVSYNHLIVSTGNKQTYGDEMNKEFANGLQSLIDALRIQRVPTNLNHQNFKVQKENSSHFSTHPQGNGMNMKQIQAIVHHRILQEEGSAFALSLNGVDKRIYEVVV